MSWPFSLFIAESEVFLRHIKLMSKKKILRPWIQGILRMLEESAIEPGSRILDIFCGTGRIALPLAKAGYKIVGIDISENYINIALKNAERRNVRDKVKFILGDARELDSLLADEQEFDAALWLWASTGYYGEEDDQLILRKLRSKVRGGGVLIMDTPNRDVILSEYEPTVIEKIGNLIFIYHHEFDPYTSILNSTWRVYKLKGKDLKHITTIPVQIRLYSLHEIKKMIEVAGWEIEKVYENYKLKPFNFKNSKMIVIKAVAV